MAGVRCLQVSIAVHRTNQWTLDQTDTMIVEADHVTGHTVVCHTPIARNAARCEPDIRNALDVPELFRRARAILDDTTNAPTVSYDAEWAACEDRHLLRSVRGRVHAPTLIAGRIHTP